MGNGIWDTAIGARGSRIMFMWILVFAVIGLLFFNGLEGIWKFEFVGMQNAPMKLLAIIFITYIIDLKRNAI